MVVFISDIEYFTALVCVLFVALATGCNPTSAGVNIDDSSDGRTDSNTGTARDTDTIQDTDSTQDTDTLMDTASDSDIGPTPIPLVTQIGLVSGGGVLRSSNYSLRLSVGGPPMAETESSTYHVRVGTGAITNQQSE